MSQSQQNVKRAGIDLVQSPTLKPHHFMALFNLALKVNMKATMIGPSLTQANA
jgi:hypothetical protein